MRTWAIVGALAVCGCASTASPGPADSELAVLLAPEAPPPALRKVRCDFIAEEGSEWSCRYEKQAPDGRWIAGNAFVAMDGGRWILIDG